MGWGQDRIAYIVKGQYPWGSPTLNVNHEHCCPMWGCVLLELRNLFLFWVLLLPLQRCWGSEIPNATSSLKPNSRSSGFAFPWHRDHKEKTPCSTTWPARILHTHPLSHGLYDEPGCPPSRALILPHVSSDAAPKKVLCVCLVGSVMSDSLWSHEL